jgi:hypothetical protein
MTVGMPLARSVLQSPKIADIFDQVLGSSTGMILLRNAAGAAWSVLTFAWNRIKRRGSEMRGSGVVGAKRRTAMRVNRISSAVTVAALNVGVFCSGSIASAADLPVKAPPPPPSAFVLDVHGFYDLSFKNAYITPRGLLVTNTGLTTQVLAGLALDLYKDKNGFINNVSVYGGTWNDIWSEQRHPTASSWNEFDWFVGMSVKFARDWKFSAEYVEFISPPGNFRIERNFEFGLFYDDSSWNPWIPINPYVKLFYAASGDSTVVTGKAGDTYDVEIGIVPTLDLKKSGLPVVLTAPTWVTVGPSDYWNRGVTGCGAIATAPCTLDNAGVFSTGLTGKAALTFIPSRLGNWYAKAGVQYYYLINDSLLLAQTFTGTAATFATAHRDVWVGSGGIGFSF